jgi:hypothetical protein
MTNLKTPFSVIIVLLCFFFASSPVEICAQNNLRIEDRIGGNGNSAQLPESNDNTFIYIAGGLLIAGVIAYALFIKKDSKPEITDSTASLNSNFIFTGKGNSESFNERISKVKEQIPIDVFLSVKYNQIVLDDKIYSLGLRIKF